MSVALTGSVVHAQRRVVDGREREVRQVGSDRVGALLDHDAHDRVDARGPCHRRRETLQPVGAVAGPLGLGVRAHLVENERAAAGELGTDVEVVARVRTVGLGRVVEREQAHRAVAHAHRHDEQ